jgi:nucleotide-binding universal stress UspA family protein
MLDFFAKLPFSHKETHITLLHVFRKPSTSEELMGEEYMQEKQPAKMSAMLNEAKNKLIKGGFHPDNIEKKLSTDPYPTITDGIIDHMKKRDYDLVVIGRKHMSKAEEFVLGDISVKLVRVLGNTAILVVKSK